MGATTLKLVNGHVVCFMCLDDADDMNLAQEIKEQDSGKYVFLCDACSELVEGVKYKANATVVPKEKR